ncbi:ABC transporter permease subunit [Paenibacillus sp. SYP-B3998]|uniref:ABC transporter permease subunit n=1 Tax=Paenibacillus sp. SYP-B3998 TaxID=2678564 RepID=A0A6G4A1S0_9BACL|nr:ABC transporter permease subunit [Paenibacillus sp. SYP-B3998]
MLNVIYTELYKLKRTNVLWLIIIGAAVPALLNLLVELEHLEWDEFFYNNLIFFTVLTGPALFTLMGGYVVAREYTERTVNQLFVYPYRRFTLMFGKLIVILIMMIATFSLNFILVILSGNFISDELLTGAIFREYAGVYLWMLALMALTIPMAMTAGIVGKSYIPPIVLGVVAILIAMMVFSGVEDTNSSRIILGSYVPFGSMVVHMADLMGKSNVAVGNYLHALYPHGIAFVLFFTFNVIYYSRSEVHSGS